MSTLLHLCEVQDILSTVFKRKGLAIAWHSVLPLYNLALLFKI